MSQSTASTSSLRSSPSGVFVACAHPSYAALALALDTAGQAFSPQAYPAFDAALCAAYPNHLGLSDTTAFNYAALAPLRQNLAVLRNHFLQLYGDQPKTIQQLATSIGEMFKHGEAVFKNPFAMSVDVKQANQVGAGAALIYQQLAKKYPTLAPLEHTPFARLDPHDLPQGSPSPLTDEEEDATEDADFRARTAQDAIAAAAALAGELPDLPELTEEDHELLGEAQALELEYEQLTDLAAISNTILKAQQHHAPLRSVEELDDKTKSRAIELGREILRKLRFHFSDVPIDQLMQANPDSIRSVMNDVRIVTDIFSKYLDDAAKKLPELLESKEVVAAMNAAGKLAAQAKLYAIKEAREAGDVPLMQKLMREHAQLPEAWRNPPEKKLGELLDQLDKGLKLLQAQLKDVTDLPDSEQPKDMDTHASASMPNHMSPEQMAAEMAQRQRIQMEIIQQDEYARMMAQRRQANQIKQGGGVMTTTPSAPTASRSAQPISAEALDHPQRSNAQSTAPLQQQQQENVQSQAQQQQRQAQRQIQRQQRHEQRIAQRQALRDQQRALRQMQRQERRAARAQAQAAAPTPAPQAPARNQFDNLLGGMDFNQMRGSLNAPMSGTLVEPNSAKKVVQDRLREGTSRREPTANTAGVNTPPPRRDSTSHTAAATRSTTPPATEPTTEPPRDPNAPRRSGVARS